MSGNKTIISAQNVEKHFNKGAIKALDGISADIYKGKVVVIIGPSGSGKSTFLRCMNLLEVPTGGHILFNGTDITDKSVDINIHRQKMGMVFQQFNVFPHLTVEENITIAPKLLKGPEGLVELAALEGPDVVLNSVVGIAGLGASLSAIQSGHDLALANKESLVTGDPV